MANLKIVLPILILSLKIILKFTVGRKVEGKNYIELSSELPTDIVFLALSFSLVKVFLDTPIIGDTVIISFEIFVLSAFVVFLFRETRSLIDEKLDWQKTIKIAGFFLLNYLISIQCLLTTSGNLLAKNTISFPVPIEFPKSTNKLDSATIDSKEKHSPTLNCDTCK